MEADGARMRSWSSYSQSMPKETSLRESRCDIFFVKWVRLSSCALTAPEVAVKFWVQLGLLDIRKVIHDVT